MNRISIEKCEFDRWSIRQRSGKTRVIYDYVFGEPEEDIVFSDIFIIY